MRLIKFLACTIAIVGIALSLLNCGGGQTASAPSMGTVRIRLSDPSTCSAPNGPFSHIYVAVTDVKIHQSASASDNDTAWVDLTPALKNSPVQVDLLGSATQCFLADLGSIGIQPGTYQQIRVILADNNTSISNNQCGNAANCVMLTNDPGNTPHPLLLSSESKTGIKIPSGQIAGGHLQIEAGHTIDFDLDFNACASIVRQGNGQYRLKPVLHAGEVTINSTAINGAVVDGATHQPIVGGTTIVALERKDSDGVDRVIMETLAAPDGSFTFCPVAAGTYDVVIASINGAATMYAPTVITGVQPGNALGTVPLSAAAPPASIMGKVTTTTGSAATAADLAVSALQSIGSGTLITIPLAQQSAATATLTTAADASCPANTACASYTLSVPASNPSIGTFQSTGIQQPTAPASGTVAYTIDARAFVPGAAGQLDCNPSSSQTSSTDTNNPLLVTSGGSVTAATLSFTGCQ